MEKTHHLAAFSQTQAPLDFAWVELTNRCNLQCLHCYAESSPSTGCIDALTQVDYVRLLGEIRALGCVKVQFIGGEPTLNRDLPALIERSRALGFEFVEVFTNLVRLPQELLATFTRFGVSVATSFYSSDPAIHDRITSRLGSFTMTVTNIRRVIASGLPFRVGLIQTEYATTEDFLKTSAFLQDLGVLHIGSDRVRKLGRGACGELPKLSELCGSCAGNILSIGADGHVAPCNMSREWAVGSVRNKPLGEIVASVQLSALRRSIRENTTDQNSHQMMCPPKDCSPYNVCCPSTQSCIPCSPNACIPCRPKG